MNLILFLRAMQLSGMLVVAFLMQVSAAGLAQQVTYKNEKAALKEIFTEIRRQTGYNVLWPPEKIDEKAIVRADFNRTPLNEVLKAVLSGLNADYTIKDKTIVVREKPSPDPGRNVIPSVEERRREMSQQPIIGRVTNENGEPLIGVSVQLKDGKTGTVTSSDGSYSLLVPSGSSVLIFSYMGFATQEMNISGRKVIDIQLIVQSADLDEVVTIGYGAVRKRDLTGAVGQANIADMRKAPVGNFEEALAGRVAGVQVTANDGQPGFELNIVVRGSNSVTQDNSPLYVVDGFPVESSVGNILNTEEIESLEVLKDASATAIYGARGANGVILITTKKGEVGAPVISYNGWLGVNEIIKQYEMMGPYEFVRYQLERNSNFYGPVYLRDGQTLEDYRSVKGTNWQDLVFRRAATHNHSLSIRGGTEKSRYAISGSILDQDGIILNSGFNKYQGRLVLDQTLNEHLKVGLNINYTSNKTYGTIAGENQSGGATASLLYSLLGFRPVTGNFETDEEMVDHLFDPDMDPSTATDLRTNPYIAVQNEYNPRFTGNFVSNAYLEYQLIDGLKLRVTGGYSKISQRSEVFFNSQSRAGHPFTANKVNGSITNSETTNLLNENTLSYSNRWRSGHNLTTLVGFTVQDIRRLTNGFSSVQIPNETLGMNGLDEGTITRAPISEGANGLMSYLGRIDYNYQSKYLLSLSYRIDGSSKFPRKNRWGYFPSASLAWRIKEDLMKSMTFVSDAKIRTGIGATGNNRVSDFASLIAMGMPAAGGYNTGNSAGGGMVPTVLGNSELKWETTLQTNVGLDLSLIKNRISLVTDYYYKETRDLLLNATLAPSMGFLAGVKNIGSVSNSGWEFTLETKNVETKDFVWNSSFNISFNRNKVLSLNEGEDSMVSRVFWGNYNAVFPYIAIPGQPIALFYGFLFDGIYQYEHFDQAGLKASIPNNGTPRANIRPGDIRYRDINGDGEVNNDDLTIIGNPNPKHIGGFSNNFAYKNLDLNVFFQWSYGRDILNAMRIQFEEGDPSIRQYLNMFASFADRWTPENPSNTLYRVGGFGPRAYSSRIIEDGSFLRLKTVSLGYNFASEQLRVLRLKSVRLYVAAQNLYTWTNYSGQDPEVSTRHTALTPSFDWSAYPRTHTFTFGLDIKF